MRAQKSKAWLLLLIVPLGFEGIWRLHHSIDAQRAALSQERDDVLLRSGKLLKVMSLEYAPFLADIYSTRVVQYYGNKHVRGDANLELLWPLLDITIQICSLPTGLAPRFSAHGLPAGRAGRTWLCN